MFHNIADKLVGASRDQQVHAVITLQQFINFAVSGGLEQAAVRKTGRDGSLVDEVEKNLVCGGRFLSAFQNSAVPTLDAEAADLDKGIRTGFKDDTDHTDRYGHAAENESCVKFPVQGDPADRIREGKQTVDPGTDIRKLVRVEFQPLSYCRSDLLGIGAAKILVIGLEDCFFIIKKGLLYGLERPVPETERRGCHLRT